MESAIAVRDSTMLPPITDSNWQAAAHQGAVLGARVESK